MYGITAERHSIKRDIDDILALLNKEIDFDLDELEIEERDLLGYEVEYDAVQHGYKVSRRPYDFEELRLLAECVRASKFISKSQEEHLLGAIENLCSDYQIEELQNEVYLVGRNKTTNKHIMATMLKVNQAIRENKKISFRLHVPKGDEEALKLSKRFDEYFAFCYKYKVLPEGGVAPVSRNASSLNRKDAISLQIVPDKDNTIEKLANGAIMIRAKNAKMLEEMLRQFAFVMDIKFPHIFKFYGSMGIYGEQLAQFGMNGKYIPERKYFE